MKRVCLYITDEQYIALKSITSERAKASEHVRRAIDLYLGLKRVRDEHKIEVDYEPGSFSDPGDQPKQDQPV